MQNNVNVLREFQLKSTVTRMFACLFKWNISHGSLQLTPVKAKLYPLEYYVNFKWKPLQECHVEYVYVKFALTYFVCVPER